MLNTLRPAGVPSRNIASGVMQVSTSIGGCEGLLSSAALEVIQEELASTSDLHLPGLWQPSSLVSVYRKCELPAHLQWFASVYSNVELFSVFDHLKVLL